MYLHCCHLLPLCSWCYCCGSLLLMFISCKCHTQGTQTLPDRPPISAIRCCTIDRQPTGKRPTTTFVCVCVFFTTYSNMVDIFCTIGYFIKFFPTTQIEQRETGRFFLCCTLFFIREVFTSCNLRADCLAGRWAIWRQVLLLTLPTLRDTLSSA